MSLDDVNNVEELVEYIKWSIQTPGTPFDGFIMTDDEIKGTAENIFNLTNGGSMKINVKLDERKYRIWHF